MTITTAQSWQELNPWQLQEIATVYLTANPDNFHEAYLRMIFILFQKENTSAAKRELRKIVETVPISELEPHGRFLLEKTDYYAFPEIENLIKPTDRLGNITIQHFSAIDSFFHAYETDKTELNLRRFVASLYRIKENFDDLDLPKVAETTDKLAVNQMFLIVLAYKFTRLYIWEKFPVIFPKPKENEEQDQKPVFGKKEQKYTPFEKIIIGLAMDELQPLGKKQDINQVRIYEFLNVLSESILYHREKAKYNV